MMQSAHTIGYSRKLVVGRTSPLVEGPAAAITTVTLVAELGRLVERYRVVAEAVGASHPVRLTCSSETSSARTHP